MPVFARSVVKLEMNACLRRPPVFAIPSLDLCPRKSLTGGKDSVHAVVARSSTSLRAYDSEIIDKLIGPHITASIVVSSETSSIWRRLKASITVESV